MGGVTYFNVGEGEASHISIWGRGVKKSSSLWTPPPPHFFWNNSQGPIRCVCPQCPGHSWRMPASPALSQQEVRYVVKCNGFINLPANLLVCQFISIGKTQELEWFYICLIVNVNVNTISFWVVPLKQECTHECAKDPGRVQCHMPWKDKSAIWLWTAFSRTPILKRGLVHGRCSCVMNISFECHESKKCNWPWKLFHRGHSNDKVKVNHFQGHPFFKGNWLW